MTQISPHSVGPASAEPPAIRIAWWTVMPYVLLHGACLLILWVGVSLPAVIAAVALYFARMFFITGFYHRYFSHRSFKTSRAVQLLFACLGCTAAQRGPLWWASHHRHHHGTSDGEQDAHSPRRLGFWVSHMGWFLQRKNLPVKERYVRDWLQFPELVWLERHALVPFCLLGMCLWGVGAGLQWARPRWGSSGPQLLVWGLAVSTVAVYHATYTINSLAHCWGSRRFPTTDDSRNNLMLALITIGEGWHNNHHWNPSVARQGLRWWEIDVTYYLLKCMAACGLIWDMRGDRRDHRPATAPTLSEDAGAIGQDSGPPD